jgi:hypothetical protein
MAEQESVAARNANKLFRKEEQAEQGTSAWKEYLEQEAATAVTQMPLPKQARRIRTSKS